jgi:hypothetical protein
MSRMLLGVSGVLCAIARQGISSCPFAIQPDGLNPEIHICFVHRGSEFHETNDLKSRPIAAGRYSLPQ